MLCFVPARCVVMILLLSHCGLICGVPVQPGEWGDRGVPEGLAQLLVKMRDMIYSWTSWTLSLERSKYQHRSGLLCR